MTEDRSPPTGRIAALSGVAAVAAYLVLFRDSAFGGRLPADETGFFDATYAGTVWEQAAAQVRAGKIPLWFHEFDCGAPLAAAWMHGLLYPGLLLFAALPLGAALAWSCALHAGLGAAGMAAFLSRRGCGAAGAAGGALLFALSDGLVGRTCAGHANLVAAIAWIPWVLLAIDGCVRGRRGAAAWLGLASGFGLLAGHVQVWALAGPMIAAFAGSEALRAGDRRGAFRRLAGGAALGLGIASPQILLTAEFLAGAAPLAEARELLVLASTPPDVLAAKVLSAWSGPPPADPAFDLRPEHRSVAGLWIFALAAWGVASRAPRRGFWTGFALFGLVASIGLRSGATAWIFDVPPFSFGRTPARVNVLALVAIPVLAGYGISFLAARMRWPAAAAACALAAAFGTPPARSVPSGAHRTDWSSAIPESARTHRVASNDSHLWWWSNVEASGLRTLRIPCYARTEGHAALLDGATSAIGWWLDIGVELTPRGPRVPRPPEVLDPREAEVSLHDAMGGARFFGACVAGASRDEVLSRLRSGERSLFLGSSSAPGTGARGEARVTAWLPGEIRVAVTSDGPGWVLVSSILAPGWVAHEGDASLPVLRGNLAFPAVHIPAAGSREIVLRYRPWTFSAGAWIAVACVAACGLALARARRHALRPPQPVDRV
ncbi:MAG: hypothetical protein HMLKMBBP_00399 [Planctomycetes bacterium]|nr:hypothetical protein [Planctomycetota bacterium]